MINKKVGIVIPIYNVELYLKECLESVINQTYKNFTAILINDGSSDNSLEIAKEYVKKDERFIIISKENNGSSSARNVGIEFFEGKYHFKEGEKEEDLFKFCLNNELNPYKIHFLYQNKNKLNEEKIDYLIFLDSDDFWKLDCLEQCVKRMEGVDVLWFGVKPFYDGIKEGDFASTLQLLDFNEESIILTKDWAKRIREKKQPFFYFSWSGMINFHFLQKIGLKFINEILQEDVPFGILLFLQANFIYVYPKEMIIYRLRAGSIMDFAGKNKKVAQYFRKQTEVFELEEDKRAYHLASSFVKMTLVLDEYLQKCDEETRSIISHYLMPTYVSQAFQILSFKNDPLNLVKKCEQIQKYIKENGAIDRIKNQLSYKLGEAILKANSPLKFLKLPFTLINLTKTHQFEQKVLQILIRLEPKFKPLELEKYADYEEALRIKKHLSYRLGQALLKNPLTFIFKIPSIYQNFKKGV